MSDANLDHHGVESQSGEPAEPSTPGNVVNLVVLDDSATDREILRRLLASDPLRDYVISNYTAIEEALDACRRSQPDCVLLDYSLSDGTGLDFLQALRTSADTRDIPVVMLTGSGSEEVVADAFRGGAQDYLGKGTLTADNLQRAVTAAIYKAQTERLLETQRRELQRLFLEAQQANARKDQFLATLSHELRTPLTPVLTAVTAIKPRELSPGELEDLFAIIRRNVLLEARLIDDLLDLTRITKGKLLLDLQPCDVHDILRHAIETCREEITAKKMNLTVDLSASASLVVADSARLQQVFWNLLKNAVKFTPANGAIFVTTRDLARRRMEITIRDTGIGITSDVMPNIFRAFDQGLEEIPRRFGGLGLGLAIAGALVEAHRGAIHAESGGRDQGATFFVDLPLAQVEAAPGRSAEARPEPEGVDPPPKISGRVLLVEDHVDSARVLAGLMRRRGLDVVVARGIEEAAQVFEAGNFDVLVSDIGLPDGTGLDLLSRISGIRQIPAIALSGYGTEADAARSREAGFREHLVKPVEWPKLNAAIVRILAHR